MHFVNASSQFRRPTDSKSAVLAARTVRFIIGWLIKRASSTPRLRPFSLPNVP
jgi:hypothetical protein